jgi:intraflagellar transport protein 80
LSMKLKVDLPKDRKHTEPVLGVGWLNTDEVVSCGDDHQLLKWNMSKSESTPLTALKSTIYPTSLHVLPRVAGRNAVSDIFLLSSSDGKIYIVHSSGKIEKAVEAHEGAALGMRWSGDATSFLTRKMAAP